MVDAKRKIGIKIAKGVAIAIFSATFIIPMWIVIIASFSDSGAFAKTGYSLWTQAFSLNGYAYVFKNEGVIRGLINSVVVTVLVTALSILVNTAAAYALHEKNMPGHAVLNTIFVFTMFFSTGMVPIVLVIKMLGLFNTFWVLVIPPVINVYNILLIRNYYYSIPSSLKEAATIDGAGQLQIFAQIMVPVSVPIIATTALMSFVLKWNSYMDILFYIEKSNTKLFTIQYVVRDIIANMKPFTEEQGYLNKYVVQSATIVVTVLPLMILFPFLQKYFVNGMTAGSVKG